MVEWGMLRKDDARKLAPAAQAHLRRLVVKAVRAGSRQTAAAKIYGVSLRGLTVSLTTVGRYLRAWGMSPQKPVRRAYERNDEAITQWLSKTYPDIARLRLFLLPGYCPELNPDELLNQDVKTNALGKSRPTNRPEMMATVRRHLHRRPKQPQVIKNLFREKHVCYAA